MRTRITEQVEVQEEKTFLRCEEYTEVVTSVEEKVVSDTVSCDMCGRRAESRWGWEDINVERNRSLDHSTIERTHFDVCPECWDALSAWITAHLGAASTVSQEEVY